MASTFPRLLLIPLCVCVCVHGPHLRLAQLSDKLGILVVSVLCSLVLKKRHFSYNGSVSEIIIIIIIIFTLQHRKKEAREMKGNEVRRSVLMV